MSLLQSDGTLIRKNVIELNRYTGLLNMNIELVTKQCIELGLVNYQKKEIILVIYFAKKQLFLSLYFYN